ncbi:integrase, partial [Streptomyces sp. DSM 41014]|nr:integrase [Streptomyces sp. DSM 41014]
MNAMRRPTGIEVGAWVRFDGQVRAVTAVTTTTVTLAQTDGSAVAVELAALLQGEDFAVIDVPVRQPLPAASLLETFPKQVREKALWWEGHILE